MGQDCVDSSRKVYLFLLLSCILLLRFACQLSVVKFFCSYIQNEVQSLSASRMDKSDPESDGEDVFHFV